MKNAKYSFKNIEIGECIGQYVAPLPRQSFIYETEIPETSRGRGLLTPFESGAVVTSGATVSLSKRAFDGMKGRNALKKGRVINAIFDGQYRSSVYKPYNKEITSEKIQINGPFENPKNSLIKKIILNGKEIYFGIVNDKLVNYSIYRDEDGKKQIKVYRVKKLNLERDKQEYFLNTYTFMTFNALKKHDRIKTKYSLDNIFLAYRANFCDKELYSNKAA